MKAIITKKLPFTSTKPTRIKASDLDGNSVTVPYDDALRWSTGETHIPAARALCEKMGWHGKLAQGSLGGDYVFVWVEDERVNTITV